MRVKDFFKMCDHPEDITWMIQDNTTNDRDVFTNMDTCPSGCEDLKINHFDVYSDYDNTIVMYLSCER